MSRNALLAVVAIALLVYGLYIGSYLLPMFVSAPSAGILIGFLVQTVAALVAAAGVWWRQSWAPIVIIVLGAAIAFTAIVEGFVLGIIGYNHAVLVSLLGLGITIVVALVIRPSLAGRLAP